jgi:hypothetical protein
MAWCSVKKKSIGTTFPFTASRLALGPTQPPVLWVPGALFVGIKRSGREANHSPPSSAEVQKCVMLYLHCHNTPSWRGAQLKNAQGQLYFTFTFQYLVSGFQLLNRGYLWRFGNSTILVTC